MTGLKRLSGIITPGYYRNPHEVVPGPDRQQQDLYVEHVAVHGLPLEQIPGNRPSEKLETALRVREIREAPRWLRSMYRNSSEPHWRYALRVCAMSVPDSVRSPRTPSTTGIFELLQYLIESADLSLVVCIDKA